MEHTIRVIYLHHKRSSVVHVAAHTVIPKTSVVTDHGHKACPDVRPPPLHPAIRTPIGFEEVDRDLVRPSCKHHRPLLALPPVKAVIVDDHLVPHEQITPVIAANLKRVGSSLRHHDTPSPFSDKEVDESERGKRWRFEVNDLRKHYLGRRLPRHIALAELRHCCCPAEILTLPLASSCRADDRQRTLWFYKKIT